MACGKSLSFIVSWTCHLVLTPIFQFIPLVKETEDRGDYEQLPGMVILF